MPLPPSDISHAYYRLYAFVVPDQLADGLNRDRIMKELYDSGIPSFSGSCGEIYVENAFDEEYIDNLGPIVAGEDHALGNMGMPQWYGVKFGMNF